MSEKLTVADLLARAQQEGQPRPDRPRRRRRRSLEEGGISVGELTGSIPVVKEREDAAHSAPDAPIEQAEQPTSAPEQPEQQLADDAVDAQPEEQFAPPEVPAEPEVVAEPEDEADPKAAAEPEDETAAEVESAAEAEAAPGIEAEPEQVAQSHTEVAHPRTDSIPFVVPAAPRAVAVDDATGDITYSFEQVAAADPTQPPFEAPVHQLVDTQESGETEVFPTVPTLADESDEPVDLNATAAVDVDEAVHEGVDADGDELAHEATYPADETEEDFDEDYEEELEGEEEDAISWPVLILEVIIGLAIGAGIFLGFEKLWASAPVWLAVVLAIAVIILLMAVVQVLRRDRDILTMIMAAAAGAAITFGPALFMN